MKVLHSIPSIEPARGGPSRAVLELARMSATSGTEVTVAFGASVSNASFATPQMRGLEQVEFRPFPYSFPKRYSASRRMNEWLSQFVPTFDIVHVHSIYSLTHLATFAPYPPKLVPAIKSLVVGFCIVILAIAPINNCNPFL